ncbi:MAG: hypothetical protein LBG90_06085, partial [Spirochaetaceae bacterium]|nr:hypothetical protein [Spirochaetaceae bacterium]
MDYANIQKEETLKAQVFEDFFDQDLCTYKPNIDNIDFVVAGAGLMQDHLLWGEAKKGERDMFDMFTQLI